MSGLVGESRGERRSEAALEWGLVEELLRRLADTHETFPTALSDSNWISEYVPGYRLRVETDLGAGWIQIENVRACWETFERLGRIRRADVLEPGRRSAFMMGLFRQIAGVHAEAGDEECLVFPDREIRDGGGPS